MSVCIFQFLIDPKTRHKWLKKYYHKNKFDKSTRRIWSIYFSMAAFINNMKFLLSNLNINNWILIIFRISLKTKRLFRYFDRNSDKTVTLSELMQNINKFRNKILDFFQKVSQRWLLNCSSFCNDPLFIMDPSFFLKKIPPVN